MYQIGIDIGGTNVKIGLLDETLEWNVAFPAMQIQNKFLKKYGPITWRDTKAIHDVTQEYIDELKIKCTSSKQKAR